MAANKKTAIVIGSGFGGLSAAIRLQASGMNVTILEKRDKPGGRAYVYNDNGFVFDAGPTVITAPECIEELFDIAGRPMSDYVELMPVTPFYRLFWEDGFVFDYSNDVDLLSRQISEKSPADLEGYFKFLKYSEDVFHEGYTKLAHVPFLNWWSMVKVSPQLVRLGAHRSVYQKVAKYIKDPHLQQAFSFHSLLVGGNPFSSSAIYTLIHFLERKWGVYFAKGGTGELVKGLIRLFEDLGGKIELNSEVDRIATNESVTKGVWANGVFKPCDLVVSNADTLHTYKKLLGQEKNAAPTAARLEKMSYSMSLFLIYFGTKKQYPNLAHHNVIFGPRYRELLTEIFQGGQLPEDFSLYLHAPTRTDASMAPPGCEAFYVLAPVPHLGKLQVDWDQEGPRYAQRILDYLEKRYIPGLSKEIVTQRIFTPKDFEKELNSHLGAAFSLEPLLTQSAFFRTHNKDRKVKGLYFVGAGTHPGAGLPGVINSGKATANLVLKEFHGV